MTPLVPISPIASRAGNRTSAAISYRLARPRAFTLFEMILSLSILSIICVSMAATIIIVGRANSNSNSNTTATANTAAAALDQITSDLKVALTITQQTPNILTFTVPDRTGDSVPDTISYAWDGTVGHPLTRQFNGGPILSIADNVTSLNFTYLTRTVGAVPAPPPTVSAEQVMCAYDTATATTNYAITATAWGAEYFKPTLPAAAVSWKITHIKLKLSQKPGSSGNFIVQVRSATAAKLPTTTILDSATVSNAIGTTGVWVDIPFSNLGGLDPAAQLAVVVSGSGAVGNLLYDNAATVAKTTGTVGRTTTANSGTNWTASVTSSAFMFYVYGTYTTP